MSESVVTPKPLESNRIFEPTVEFVELIVNLLNLPQGAKILVVEMTQAITEYAQSQGYQVVRIDGNIPVDRQVKKIRDLDEVDGAFITPVFSAKSRAIASPEGWQELGNAASEDQLIAHAVDRLKPSGSLAAIIPQGLLSNFRRKAIREGLVRHGLVLVASIPPQLLLSDYRGPVSMAVALLRRNNTAEDRTITVADLSDVEQLPPREIWRAALDGLPSTGWAQVEVSGLRDDLRLDPQYYDQTYLQIKPPPGYVAYSLGEIAEIRGGIHFEGKFRLDEQTAEHSRPYLQVRHILPNGQIAPNVFWVNPSQIGRNAADFAKPGDILVTTAGTIGKVAIVPDYYSEGVFFDTSLRVLRVNTNLASVDSVYQFLRSEIGQLQFRRLTSGTAIPVLATPGLASMQIFLPVSPVVGNDATETPLPELAPNVAQAHVLADAIQAQLVDYLRRVTPEETNWPQTVEQILSTLTRDLVTKPLERIVLEDFPAPISIPYRRFLLTKHNPYERLDRMVSLVEACIYFAFNVLLADYCHKHRLPQLQLSPEAKQALKGSDIMNHKLQFISDLITGERNGLYGLYMPELADSAVFAIGNKFRTEVRNIIAHTAPGSESYVKSLIDLYEPEVERLLESLRFLSDYTLCRVRNYFYHNGQWNYQAELYRGAEYDIYIKDNIVSVSTNDEQDSLRLLAAEREHLVLLSADFDVLDLYPFYQLYFGTETCRESHFFFFKRYTAKKSEYIGESVRSGIEVRLSGMKDFVELTSAPPPTSSESSEEE